MTDHLDRAVKWVRRNAWGQHGEGRFAVGIFARERQTVFVMVSGGPLYGQCRVAWRIHPDVTLCKMDAGLPRSSQPPSTATSVVRLEEYDRT